MSYVDFSLYAGGAGARTISRIVIVVVILIAIMAPVSFHETGGAYGFLQNAYAQVENCNTQGSVGSECSISTGGTGTCERSGSLLVCVEGGVTPPGEIENPLLRAINGGASSAIEWFTDSTIGVALRGVAWLLLSMMGWLLAASAFLLEKSMLITTGTGDGSIYALATVTEGWGIVLGIANIFFIFALLYIAIATILQLGNFQTKQVLTRLIVIALLVNFSLYATSAVIHVSNTLAVGFYNKIIEDKPLTDNLMESFALETIADPDIFEDFISDSNEDAWKNLRIAQLYLYSAIFIAIAAFIFLATAIMLIIRTVVLMILMIFAPLAFLAWVLPGTQGYFKQWWEKLFNQAFFVPVLFFMLFIAIELLTGPFGSVTGGDNANASRALLAAADGSGSFGGGTFDFLFHFAVVITLLILSLTVAKGMAKETASVSIAWASKGAGAALGYGGRMTAGLGGTAALDRLNDADWVQKGKERAWWRPTRIAADLATGTAKRAAAGSYDIRGAGIPGVEGKPSGVGGYEAMRDKEREKQVKAREENIKANLKKAAQAEKDKDESAKDAARKAIQNSYQKASGPIKKELNKTLSTDLLAQLRKEGAMDDATYRNMPTDRQESIDKAMARLMQADEMATVKDIADKYAKNADDEVARGELVNVLKEKIPKMSKETYSAMVNANEELGETIRDVITENMGGELGDMITPAQFTKSVRDANMTGGDYKKLGEKLDGLDDGHALKQSVRQGSGFEMKMIKAHMKDGHVDGGATGGSARGGDSSGGAGSDGGPAPRASIFAPERPGTGARTPEQEKKNAETARTAREQASSARSERADSGGASGGAPHQTVQGDAPRDTGEPSKTGEKRGVEKIITPKSSGGGPRTQEEDENIKRTAGMSDDTDTADDTGEKE